jgi:hypothetical protein
MKKEALPKLGFMPLVSGARTTAKHAPVFDCRNVR